MIIRNIANGLRLLDHFVTVQNRWMALHREPLKRNLPEMWRADPKGGQGGMNTLSLDDWLDIMAAYHVWREQTGARIQTTMWRAADELERMLLDEPDRFVQDLQRPLRGSNYKNAAWRFMCSFRDNVNDDEGLDPMRPDNRFHDLFD